jgi:hypothetical protein
VLWLYPSLPYGAMQVSPPYLTRLVQEPCGEVNRVQGVLEWANIRFATVATAVTGGRPAPSWPSGEGEIGRVGMAAWRRGPRARSQYLLYALPPRSLS